MPEKPTPFRRVPLGTAAIIASGLLLQYLTAFAYFSFVPEVLVTFGYWTFWPAWAIHSYWAYYHYTHTNEDRMLWTIQGLLFGTFSYFVLKKLLEK
jgi:hypothetical protein